MCEIFSIQTFFHFLQAGFMTILCEKFWVVLTTSLSYIILSIIVHAWTLIIRWNAESIHAWPFGFYCCFTVHRFGKCASSQLFLNRKIKKSIHSLYILFFAVSVIHYYVYKRTALRISDHRLYEDEWINHIVHHRNL